MGLACLVGLGLILANFQYRRWVISIVAGVVAIEALVLFYLDARLLPPVIDSATTEAAKTITSRGEAA